MKKFSFIIPVYNCAPYLIQCIEKIQAIDKKNYEIIIINDGSTDNSDQICRELSGRYNNIKYFYQENRGVSVARNKGLSMSKGDYIIFLDVDDTIEPDEMRKVLYEVENNCEIDLVIFGISFDYYYNNNCYRQDKLFYSEPGCIHREKWINNLDKLYEVNALSPIWNKVFRRDILVNNHLLFNTEMFLYEDFEFSIRYLSYCNIICNIPECIYHYRQAEDEGNAGRRLMRIEKLSDLINQIEVAFDKFMEIQNAEDQTQKIKAILLELYCVIAREKIAVSSIDGIEKICNDFIRWIKEKNPVITEKNVLFVNQLLHCKKYHFFIQRIYIYYRHKFAVWIKNTKYYQKNHK